MDMLSKTDEILERLDLLDLYCTEHKVKANLVILGASGILLYMELQKRTFRPTRDIDVNILWSDNRRKLFELLQKVQIDLVGGVMELPPMEDFQDENLFEISDLGFLSIRIYVPSIELLACSKIFSTREKDLRDLKETPILEMCDIEKLKEMVDEYAEYMINPDNMNYNVHQFESILMEKGLIKDGE